ncbi:MAG: aminoglycoside phosphotransferase family protein [Pseudomonadota bacterium]|uniref:aminoglycoside phosphotransferase family protein n=1 Tax=Roseovarius TaxID=74030 RepID=UPI0022A7C456|nr:phosphotransferase [Roseovarius sp. EGI FJ00037]MCZ0811263.1 phosphotransferase [Roseovarius sp. EGI FJ00037]
MTERDALIRAFIDAGDWAGGRIAPLAGDASNRRYLRLRDPASGDTAVLMDAPPDRGEDVRPFVEIAHYLRGIGLSAPRILDADMEAGLLLLEDLGDDLFANVIPRDPALENSLYCAATDLLGTLHDHPPPPGLAPYSPALMADLAMLAFDWYRAALADPAPDARASTQAAILAALHTHASDADVLIQRDYHAQNLLWMPDRQGDARVGLLDFQDAMLGHRAYDLVSLLQDARRDVPRAVEDAMLTRYIDRNGMDSASFRTAYHALGAQRNLRIIGVFARLCIRDGKPHYVDLIPRVWDHLQSDLADPALAPLARILENSLPSPSPASLAKVKAQCPTAPVR